MTPPRRERYALRINDGAAVPLYRAKPLRRDGSIRALGATTSLDQAHLFDTPEEALADRVGGGVGRGDVVVPVPLPPETVKLTIEVPRESLPALRSTKYGVHTRVRTALRQAAQEAL